ncbi:MAG: hypothetical protein AAB834_06535, partial [Patescibacteria group bacterium]
MNIPARTLRTFFSSRLFLYVVLGFFVFEALWFVFSALYPMAFDEEFHLGVIKIYAGQWLPFLAGQPDGADAFGAVARDPSYLYHYIMSFPYRFLTAFTHNETTLVIILRIINIAVFTWGLLLFRKLMLRAGVSPALSNVALALFVLIPIVPQLAAHINYDNLLMVLVPVLCLLSFRLIEGFREHRIDSRVLLYFAIVCLMMSLVKYAALPIVAAAVSFLVVYLVLAFRGRFGKLWHVVSRDFMRISRVGRVVLAGLFLLASGLFAQRYAVNMVQYGTPVPDCGNVLTVKQCSAYGPWIRDHDRHKNLPAEFRANPVVYMGSWLGGMWHRLFFAVNGPKSDYLNYAQLPVP